MRRGSLFWVLGNSHVKRFADALSIGGCALPVRGGGGHDSAIEKTGTSLQRRIASSATPNLHTWIGAHVAKILTEFHESVRREPLIPLGASLGFVPKRCLIERLFLTIEQARTATETWRLDYNQVRPHSALGNLAHKVYANRTRVGIPEPTKIEVISGGGIRGSGQSD